MKNKKKKNKYVEKKKKKKMTTFDILNKRLKKEKPCFKLKKDSPLSFQKCIEIWGDIELIKYNNHEEKLLKKLRSEIKEIIFSKILYKNKKKFSPFSVFYN
ncbi:hypothetical protein PFLG_03017 [Plasmodium falciparum RAJ116]|uniref:Uncharacterized protein n=1 Tax=Plasmodium falciparum RAJ116 TaxID=580058 RepID=A0A0L0D3C2_PLAFA|nr:hypothetical protein PFLG_03017 [Plasmodium falciparum RAJ116]